MLRSALTVSRRTYILAFNAKAKARPNFGLRGVGYHTSEVYSTPGQAYWAILSIAAPIAIMTAILWDNFWAKLDDFAGGGAKVFHYQFNSK